MGVRKEKEFLKKLKLILDKHNVSFLGSDHPDSWLNLVFWDDSNRHYNLRYYGTEIEGYQRESFKIK